MTREMRRRAIAGLLLAASAASMTGCTRHTAEEVDTQTAVAVKTARARAGAIRGVVHATGVVSPSPGAELIVVAPEAARIADIPRAAGDRVRRGDVLVRFEIPSAAADVQKQQAEVARAGAAVENAKAAQARARDLFERGVAARKEVEDADRAVADADAAQAQARASLGAARAVAGRSIVRATFDGIIAARRHNPGDLVEPSAGDPVLRVIDTRRLEVLASVPLADALRIELGAPARLSGAPVETGDVRLKVLSRPAAVEAGTATVPVRVAFLVRTPFPAGTPVQVDIDAEQHTNVVLVPAAAIVRDGAETAVFVASGGKAQRRAVRIGLADHSDVEIVSGVTAGDTVIIEGQAGLPDGAPITVSGEGAGKAPRP